MRSHECKDEGYEVPPPPALLPIKVAMCTPNIVGYVGRTENTLPTPLPCFCSRVVRRARSHECNHEGYEPPLTSNSEPLHPNPP